MSLTQFIKEHAPIRDAFAALHNSECRKRLPSGRQKLLVAPSSANSSFVGTAFDYLARWQLASRLADTSVNLAGGAWVADMAAARLKMMCRSAKAVKRWNNALLAAHDGATIFDWKREDVSRLADHAQMVAHLDYLYRYPDGFDPDFEPRPEVTGELVQLISIFAAEPAFSARRLCIFNPGFVASPVVGGADADLVIDDTLVDLKVTKALAPTTQHLLQLAGYLALHRIGGIPLGDAIHKAPFKSVAIYSARYGAFISWELRELFLSAGFDKFCKAFAEEVPHWRSSYVVRREFA